MYDWLAAIARWLEVNVISLPIYFAAPAMIIIGALDSSLLSLPEINDYLVVGRCFKDPSAAFYFPLFAAIGSVIGCNLLYTIVRRGGQAVLRKRWATMEELMSAGERNQRIIADIIEEETTEDFERIGGSQPLDVPYRFATAGLLVRRRIGWLMILFVAGLLTSQVLEHYSDRLQGIPALIPYIPLIIGIGGNVGSQTVTTLVRAIGVGEVRLVDVGWVLAQEMVVGLSVGLIMGFVGYLRVGFPEGFQIGLVVGATIVCVSERTQTAPTTASVTPTASHAEVPRSCSHLGAAKNPVRSWGSNSTLWEASWARCGRRILGRRIAPRSSFSRVPKGAVARANRCSSPGHARTSACSRGFLLGTEPGAMRSSTGSFDTPPPVPGVQCHDKARRALPP